jgi:hypothetical protein
MNRKLSLEIDMKKQNDILIKAILMGSLLSVFSQTANAIITMPKGDVLLNGAFIDLEYGAGGLAYVTPQLYVGDLLVTESPDVTASTTDLSFKYSVAGLGTSLSTISYFIKNEGSSDFTDLRFFVDVQADGNSGFTDFASVIGSNLNSKDPTNYQISDFSVYPLSDQIAANDILNNTNACGAFVCDADLGLQWDLATLAGQNTWLIQVALSDNGNAISNLYLDAISSTDSSTQLSFSGTGQTVVPLPSSVILMFTAILPLFRFRKAIS